MFLEQHPSRQILAFRRHGPPGPLAELPRLLSQGVRLSFELVLRRGDVDQPPTDAAQHLLLPGVGVIQQRIRILGAIDHGIGASVQDQPHP
jgi:hypothetical protein